MAKIKQFPCGIFQTVQGAKQTLHQWFSTYLILCHYKFFVLGWPLVMKLFRCYFLTAILLLLWIAMNLWHVRHLIFDPKVEIATLNTQKKGRAPGESHLYIGIQASFPTLEAPGLTWNLCTACVGFPRTIGDKIVEAKLLPSLSKVESLSWAQLSPTWECPRKP